MLKIRVLVVEDHAVVRQGLKALLRASPDIQVASEAEDGHAAVKVAKRSRPDIILMDVAMPRMNGLEATKEILTKMPKARVLVLSTYSDDELVVEMMQAGAAGYLTKHAASVDLLEAIRQVHRGSSYFSPAISKRLGRRSRAPLGNGAAARPQSHLTAREREVLTLIAQGLASKQIASKLGVSSKTIEKHRQQVMLKLDLHEIASLTRYAVDKGLVTVKAQVAA